MLSFTAILTTYAIHRTWKEDISQYISSSTVLSSAHSNSIPLTIFDPLFLVISLTCFNKFWSRITFLTNSETVSRYAMYWIFLIRALKFLQSFCVGTISSKCQTITIHSWRPSIACQTYFALLWWMRYDICFIWSSPVFNIRQWTVFRLGAMIAGVESLINCRNGHVIWLINFEEK